MNDDPNRVDPDTCHGLGPGQVMQSTLVQVPNALYRSPDVDAANGCRRRADKPRNGMEAT